MRVFDHETEPATTGDGITLYQTIENEQFDVPSVVLTAVSDRDDPVRARVVVEIPDELEVDRVGFHPGYRKEDWTVADGRLEFEAEIGPGGEVTTVYAVESLQSRELDLLLENLFLEVDSVDIESTKGQADAPGDGGRARRGLDRSDESGSGTSGDSPDDGSAVTPETPREENRSTQSSPETSTPESAGTSDAGSVRPRSPESGGTAPSDGETTGTSGSDALTEFSTTELVSEIEGRIDEADLSQQDRAHLQDLLQGEEETGDVSDEQRPSYLGEWVRDVEASLELVQEFDEQYGHLVEAFEELETELEEISRRVERLEDDTHATEDSVERIESRIEGLEADLRSVESNQDGLESRISDLADWRENVRKKVGTLDEEDQ